MVMEIIFGKAYEIKGFIILTGLPGKRHRAPQGATWEQCPGSSSTKPVGS